MGAEWDAIAIRMSPCAFRWVRKRIQLRSERFPMHPDVCGMGQNMQPHIPIHDGSIWITIESHWTQTGRHTAGGFQETRELALSISMAHMSVVSTLDLVQMTGSSIAWAANHAGYLLSLNLVEIYRNH